MHVLFEQAASAYKGDPGLAKSYLLTAKRVAMSARIRLPKEYKRRICGSCGELLVPGLSSRVRIKSLREPHVVVTCLKCNSQHRFLLRPKRKETI